MGQYFKACFITAKKDKVKKYFDSWDTNNGSKLMEHSYVGNHFVMNVTYKLINSPQRLVWAGDYADEVVGEYNYYMLCDNTKKSQNKIEMNVIEQALNENTIYINHDKKEWFDLKKQTIPDMKGWNGVAHPLPILTADGNGRGGGDYEGAHMEMVGMWKGDLIEVSDTIPADYKEIKPFFTEMNDTEIKVYMKALNSPKKGIKIRRSYTTYEEIIVEARTEEEALQMASDINPDETQVYEHLTIDGSPIVVGCE